MNNYEPKTTLQKIKIESLLRTHMDAIPLYTDDIHGIFSVDTIEHGKQILFTDERADTFNTAQSCMLESRWIEPDSLIRKICRITGFEIGIKPVVESAGLEVTHAILHSAEPDLRLISALSRVTGFDVGFMEDYTYIDLPDTPSAYYRHTGVNKRNVQVIRSQAVPYAFAQVHTSRYLESLIVADDPVIPTYWLTHGQVEATGQWERVAIDVQGSPDLEKRQIARRTRWLHDVYEYTGKYI